MTDRIDPIATAIDHIRSVTPADNPWTADDVSSFSPWEPDESDYAIATILNAVVSGQLIHRASRDEMLAQVRRGEGFATAGAEARWIADSEAGVYDTDAPDPIAAARALIEPLNGYTPGPWDASGLTVYDTCMDGVASCHAGADARLIAAAPVLRDMVATLADALEAERAKVAAAHEAVANIARSHIYYDSAGSGFREDEFNDDIRTLTPADAQASLDKMLAEARLEGWRAGRDAATDCAEDYCSDMPDLAGHGHSVGLRDAIRALPEPKEANHD